MARIFLLACLLCPLVLQALQKEPWLRDAYQPYIIPGYSYQYYPSVNNGINPSSYSSKNNFLSLGASMAFGDTWDLEAVLAIDQSRKLDWGFELGALQARYVVFDQLRGDFCSMTVGGNLTIVTHKRLTDVTTPYHGLANLEAGFSIGREFATRYRWDERIYCYFAVGQAEKGLPWVRGFIENDVHLWNFGIWRLFADGYFGFGRRNTVDIDAFSGYANIRHQSIDIGTGLTYITQLWGRINANYSYRIYAHSYPQSASTLVLEYVFPLGV
ncbi:MAG: hypothetical protein S4CHLAM102_10120 [Chlamydiia bacterium]|nr:hypothetical protein [Chlamydiia bacterium]